jgi:hypothetical protein
MPCVTASVELGLTTKMRSGIGFSVESAFSVGPYHIASLSR